VDVSNLAARAERLGGRAGKLILLILAGAAAPVEARVWGSPAGWVVQDFPEACGMERKFEGAGNTAMSVTWHVDQGVLLHVSNFEWPIKKGDKFEVIARIDGRALDRRATAYENDGRKGFGTFLRQEHLNAIAAGAEIGFHRADTGALIDSLSLDGSGAAVALMRRCLLSVRARVAEERRGKAVPGHVPANALADPVVPGRPAEAEPMASIPSLVSGEDYPAAAIRAGEQGQTGYRLTVGTNGRVTGCTITSSSGSAVLDSTTCRILRARARFRPARDSKGEPVEGSYRGALKYSLFPWQPEVAPAE
jgi:TonB family protein